MIARQLWELAHELAQRGQAISALFNLPETRAISSA